MSLRLSRSVDLANKKQRNIILANKRHGCVKWLHQIKEIFLDFQILKRKHLKPTNIRLTLDFLFMSTSNYKDQQKLIR